ncbi:hypothetical protein [Edaphobacter sp. 12200R-103]|jgi:hypothetical protein|uniref:hypothetical protein n=1 Tax=Edaphobacter sp. 12200R-103 TaxID=2703788 RepID=UPI00138CE896|nr:hypothetical protein [Edaphobacter sp. 12200R-103]QHS52660.1 hypothetical protein GWR55_13740 [Edaphobacter sp. 12200R-103]
MLSATTFFLRGAIFGGTVFFTDFLGRGVAFADDFFGRLSARTDLFSAVRGRASFLVAMVYSSEKLEWTRLSFMSIHNNVAKEIRARGIAQAV